MKRRLCRKSLLLSGILLFSVLVSGQSAWACDEPAGECYVQLDIKWVDVDLYNSLIYIWGEHFDNGGPPVVALGGYPLDIISGLSNAEWIVAALPRVPEDIAYGQYRLRVSTGNGHKCKDKYSVKIHPAPPKPPSEPCPPGPTCTCEPEACTYTCPQPTCTCPQATFASTTITNDLPVDANETISGSGLLFGAATQDCPSGTKLTGGGFEVLSTNTTSLNLLTGLSILASKPSDTGNGWFVRGIITKVEFNQGDNFILRIYAVCGKVEQ